MSGNLPFNTEIPFTAAGEYVYGVLSFIADADYRVDEASLGPDGAAVTAGTYAAAILIVIGGADAGALTVQSVLSPSGTPNIGLIRQGLLQDPSDPTGSGLNLVQMLANVAITNDYSALREEDKPLIREGQVVAIVVINSSMTPDTTPGVIVATIRGHQVERRV